MKRSSVSFQRTARSGWRRECARDSVQDVDPMTIDVRIGNQTDVPLEFWRERLKRDRRRKPPPRPEPAPETDKQQEGRIDDYAAPPGL